MSKSKSQDALIDVAERALHELGRRLEADPESIPAHVLSKVAADTMRVLDRREDKEEEDDVVQPFSLLDELDAIPVHRGDKLLDLEIQRVRKELNKLLGVQRARKEVSKSEEASRVRSSEEEREVEGVSGEDFQLESQEAEEERKEVNAQ